eukprot:1139160-Pelagomonas_calceolata.AAC.2
MMVGIVGFEKAFLEDTRERACLAINPVDPLCRVREESLSLEEPNWKTTEFPLLCPAFPLGELCL